MVKISVKGDFVEISIGDGSFVQENDEYVETLKDLILKSRYKLETWTFSRDVTGLSNTAFHIEVQYENERLSQTVGKAVELWTQTRGIEVKLDKRIN